MEIVEQVNITMPNIPSSLAKVGDMLRASDVNIEAINCTEGPTHTIIHLIVSDTDTAKLVLKNLGPVSTTNVLSLKMPNRPGAIADIGRGFAAMGINIRTIYSATSGKEGVVYIGVDNPTEAGALLQQWEKSPGKLR